MKDYADKSWLSPVDINLGWYFGCAIVWLIIVFLVIVYPS